MTRTTFVSVAISLTCVGNVTAAEFHRMGYIGITEVFGSSARAVANNGQVVGSLEAPIQPVRWTPGGDLIPLPGFSPRYTTGTGISADGNWVVGQGTNGAGQAQAYVWSEQFGIQWLDGSRAADISADGSVIVGSADGEAARWTEDRSLERSGLLPGSTHSIAEAVSADGTTIVGRSFNYDTGHSEGFHWSRQDGLMGLGVPAGFDATYAYDVSADGTFVVGEARDGVTIGVADDSELTGEAFRWATEIGWELLGTLPGFERSVALSVSGDGQVVVGYSSNSPSIGGDDRRAFIWTEESGIQDLQNILIDDWGLGDSLGGWQLTRAAGISQNGRYIVGSGWSPRPHYLEGWRIQFNPLAELGDVDHDGELSVGDTTVMADRIRAGTYYRGYDLNADDELTMDDFLYWIHDLKQTWVGDANLDGQFNSNDLVQVLAAGKYEQDVAANWAEGDWTADARFDTHDLVAALQDGGFEQGARAAVHAVPEPSATLLWLAACWILTSGRLTRADACPRNTA